MGEAWNDLVLEASGASRAWRQERIQSLWSGYGEILRVGLEGAAMPSLILKHVMPPDTDARGAAGRSHARKLASYQNELAWYRGWHRCCASRVPAVFALREHDGEFWLLLEDLDAAGYSLRLRRPKPDQIRLGLDWLARFHAAFLGADPQGLWPVGSYWHLATRPDELKAMPASPLKQAAADLDARLDMCRYRTIIHGDAKLANFCFGSDGSGLAAVDFQYVGGGCGIRDLAYFLDSCLDEAELETRGEAYLDDYFKSLRQAIAARGDVDPAAVEAEWRALYPIAWADFQRFLAGWMPGAYPMGPYSRRQVALALASLAC